MSAPQRETAKSKALTGPPDNNGVSYEEIRAILWRRHKTNRIGDNDVE